jgi:type VII secretion integral membrane protein EccD
VVLPCGRHGSYARGVPTVTGLVRVTVLAPHRRLDVALPAGVAVAELLPELVRRAGEEPGRAPAGWSLRRAGGSTLLPARPLADHGIRDGEVVHLVPSGSDWPAPVYDDPVEAIAAAGRQRAQWSPTATAQVATWTAALVLAGGLVVTVTGGRASGPLPAAAVAGVLLAAPLAARRFGPRRAGTVLAGTVLAGAAVLYAAVAGARWAPWDLPLLGGAMGLLAGSLLAAALWSGLRPDAAGEGRAAGTGGPLLTAGMVVGVLGIPAALIEARWGAAAAAAVVACVVVCGPAGLPLLALRLAGLPPPPVRGPASEEVFVAVTRADDLLAGMLAGWALLAVASSVVLLHSGGTAGMVLAAMVGGALALRARHWRGLGYRLVLLAGGLAGLCGVAVVALFGAPPRVAPLFAAGTVVVALLLLAVAARPDRVESPGLARAAAVADTLCVVSVVPAAAAVLDLYPRAQALLALPPPI